jgi:hypothetical protein
VTRDSHNGDVRLQAPLDHELSPELALVDPDAAERARDELPDITPTEIKLSLSFRLVQAPPPAPAALPSSPDPVAVAELAPAAPAPASGPALVRPADAPPPPYDEIRRVFHEPLITPARGRRSIRAALVILAVAAGAALALPRALDGPSSQTSAKRRSSRAPAAAASTVHRPKSKPTSKAKPKVHKKAAASPAQHTHPAHKAKRAAKKRVAAPPASSTHVSKRKPRAHPVPPHPRMLPDFVWAPAKGAKGYLVEFLTGSKVVLRTHTRAARLRLSAKQLHRGRYRWLVWQLGEAGAPIGKPLVDSKVTVR